MKLGLPRLTQLIMAVCSGGAAHTNDDRTTILVCHWKGSRASQELHDLKATVKLLHEHHSWIVAKIFCTWNISRIYAIFIGVMRPALDDRTHLYM